MIVGDTVYFSDTTGKQYQGKKAGEIIGIYNNDIIVMNANGSDNYGNLATIYNKSSLATQEIIL